MSDNIPFEIQIEIMKRFPVKPLIRFRSVSKAWKSLIDSSDFIAQYGVTRQVQHLLVNYHHYVRYNQNYVSIIDDDTFPQHKVSPDVPLLVNMLKCSKIIGSSGGLLCFHGYREGCDFPDTNMLVLWNISVRKAIAVVVPSREYGDFGFGVCRETNDPKIVKIIRHVNKDSTSYINWQVELFTLKTGAWRSLYNNLPRKSVEIFRSQVVIDGILYWLAKDKISIESGFKSYSLIVSFDITSEEFREVNLPDTLADDQIRKNLYISKLRKSLVVLESDGVENNPSFVVWMMEDGISKSFTKLFTIYAPHALILGVLEFRKSGEPILEISEHRLDSLYHSSLVVYEPYSKHFENLGFEGTDLSFSVSSYKETLLLHDLPNFLIYDKGKHYVLKRRAKTRKHSRSIQKQK